MPTNDLLFAEERPGAPQRAEPDGGGPWLVLVVDDDPEVHAVTRLALSGIRFKERRLEAVSAYSAAEAAALLRSTPDIALVLLDVVMETDDAGLTLVRFIREELGNRTVRIVLRTGQPGQAPEESVILAYDINDYKAKPELTAHKLFTTVVSALRAYADMTALENSRRALQSIIDSTDRLFELRSLRRFTDGALAHLQTFLGGAPDGLLCTRQGADGIEVLAGAGRFAGTAAGPLAGRVRDPEIAAAVGQAFRTRRTVFGDGHATLHIGSPETRELVAWARVDRPLDPMERQLVEVFASKMAIGFANVCLYERLREANELLEARVAERTRALEEANAKLERLATTDALTGAWNRRHLMDMAAGEVARARRYIRPLSVLMFDLDHFKQVNDTLGHAAGDEALKTVVSRARDALRATDHIGRFGGEEFVVLLPETGEADARVVAERVRTALAAEPVAFDGHAMHVTASIGVATWHGDEPSIEMALRRADAALYEAKQAGRDRVAAAK